MNRRSFLAIVLAAFGFKLRPKTVITRPPAKGKSTDVFVIVNGEVRRIPFNEALALAA